MKYDRRITRLMAVAQDPASTPAEVDTAIRLMEKLRSREPLPQHAERDFRAIKEAVRLERIYAQWVDEESGVEFTFGSF